MGEEREIWGKRKRKLWEIEPINVKNVKNQSCGDFEKLMIDAKKNILRARFGRGRVLSKCDKFRNIFVTKCIFLITDKPRMLPTCIAYRNVAEVPRKI